MEFISLAQVVASIAESIEVPPHLDQLATFADKDFQAAVNGFWEANNPKIEWTRMRSFAALQLNEALHHGDDPLRWMEYDEAKRFAVENKVIGLEAIDILTRTTGLGSELLNRCSTHIRNASVGCRVDLLDADFSRTQSNEVAPLRPLRIGFDRAKLIPFLDANGIAHNLGEQDKANTQPQTAPESKEQRQDRRLKACIDAGLPMNDKTTLIRLPDGVGNVADSESVTRQAFSTDVKAALKRREAITKTGRVVRHT